jgi:hypothetical protein
MFAASSASRTCSPGSGALLQAEIVPATSNAAAIVLSRFIISLHLMPSASTAPFAASKTARLES